LTESPQTDSEIEVGPIDELPPGEMKLIEIGSFGIGVYNCGGRLYAIEDRCSHDDGPVAHGAWDAESCTVICPRHGAQFDLETGKALSLPAYLPIRTFPVRVEDEIVKVEIG
jgi:3-phenylpropionate/trans-cinnamate dioxygenase ferredoxin component